MRHPHRARDAVLCRHADTALYCPHVPLQDDLLYATLTVHETLYFAAMLRLPKHKTKADKVGWGGAWTGWLAGGLLGCLGDAALLPDLLPAAATSAASPHPRRLRCLNVCLPPCLLLPRCLLLPPSLPAATLPAPASLPACSCLLLPAPACSCPPPCLPPCLQLARVDSVIEALGLQRCRDTIIGDHLRRGVSGE